MATIRLDREEAEQGDLPDLCLQCGAAATARAAKTFAWHPPWIGLLILLGIWPYVIVALILTKRLHVQAPFCDRHKNHWQWRNLVIAAGLAALMVVLVGVIAVAILGPTRDMPELLGVLFGGFALLFAGWLTVALVLAVSAIRAVEITDESITLTGVAQPFADAVYRRGEEDDAPEKEWLPRHGLGGRRDLPQRPAAPPDSFQEK